MTTLNLATTPDLKPSDDPRSDRAQSPAPVALHVAIPKGRMYDGVVALFAEAGIRLSASARGYRPTLSLPGVEAKIGSRRPRKGRRLCRLRIFPVTLPLS